MSSATKLALVSPRPDLIRPPLVGPGRLMFAETHDRLNHNVFRYPAKFHPPVARALVNQFSAEGETVLDPFCGSGTTLVEGLVSGRSVVGTDIDPLAIMVSAAKIRHYDLNRVDSMVARLRTTVDTMRRADMALWGGFEVDIDLDTYTAAAAPLLHYIPELPRIGHWFRRRAVVQLAAIRALIASHPDAQLRFFLNLCFAAIIRNSSNADPVPVSGLEVTSHMRRKEEAGRAIDPYGLFATALAKTATAMRAFAVARAEGTAGRVAIADARDLSGRGTGRIDSVVTSPPYLMAVDYYRRHTLETYWLGLTSGSGERLATLPRYIGRDRVAIRQIDAVEVHSAGVAQRRLPDAAETKTDKARAFRHYCISMGQVLRRMSEVTRPSGNIVFVIGDVRFCGVHISMVDLLQELADPHLALVERLWYPLDNRYMSYSRKNEADINADHVLVFRRRN